MISTLENAASAQATGKTKLETITLLTAAFAREHDEVKAIVQELEEKKALLLNVYLKKIRTAASKARTAKMILHTAIEAAPELFKKPRTIEINGIKIGFRKGTGGIDWDDDAKVVALIEKHFSMPEAELLIKVTKEPIAKALAGLEVAELKKLGCRVESTGDEVVIKPTGTAIDKIVAALLKDTSDEVQA